jgi:RND family efflux transporter MFP subunit
MKIRFTVPILAGFSAALVLLGAGCQKSAGPPGAPPPAAVTVSQPVQREVVEWDEYPGRLDAVDMVDIRSRVTGYLESIHFKEGAEVKKGDLLYVIDPRPYQTDFDHTAADVEQARSKLELAKNDLERAKKLLESKAISAEEADSRSKSVSQDEAAVQSAVAMHEMAHLNLDYTHITAPINGRIGRKLVTEGNLVNGSMGQTTLLTTIVSMDPIYCYFDADERSVLKYQQLAREGKGEDFLGGKVLCEVELANETSFPHKGVLDFVDNRVDPATGTMKFSHFFIGRPIFASVLSIVIVIAGLLALLKLPVAEYPPVVPPTVVVKADLSRRQPASHCRHRGHAHRRGSQRRGRYALHVRAMRQRRQHVVDRHFQDRHGPGQGAGAGAKPGGGGRARLPEEVRRLGVTTAKQFAGHHAGREPVFPGRPLRPGLCQQFRLLQVKDALARLPGVGSIIIFGARDYSMRIWLDPEKIASRNLTADDVVNAIREQNVQVAAGQIGQPPMARA